MLISIFIFSALKSHQKIKRSQEYLNPNISRNDSFKIHPSQHYIILYNLGKKSLCSALGTFLLLYLWLFLPLYFFLLYLYGTHTNCTLDLLNLFFLFIVFLFIFSTCFLCIFYFPNTFDFFNVNWILISKRSYTLWFFLMAVSLWLKFYGMS